MSWHEGETDSNGNVRCSECGHKQSGNFEACIYCCDHSECDIKIYTEDFCGSSVELECSRCGWSSDLDIDDYKAVKK